MVLRHGLQQAAVQAGSSCHGRQRKYPVSAYLSPVQLEIEVAIEASSKLAPFLRQTIMDGEARHLLIPEWHVAVLGWSYPGEKNRS